MPAESNDLWRSMRNLAERTWTAPVRNARRYGDELGRLGRGDAPPGTVLGNLGRFLRSEPGRYARDLADLGLGTANALLDLNIRFQERFLDEVFGQAGETVVALEGALGEELRTSFSVDNRFEDSLSVEIQAGTLSPEGQEGGGELALVKASPERFEVAPGGSQEVSLIVKLDPEQLRADTTYIGRVRVAGREEKTLVLRLRVKPSAD